MDILNIDLFAKEITYLPFDTVKSLCQTDQQLHEYCTNPRYSNVWKSLIDNAFSNTDYQNGLESLLEKYGGYNYLVYVNLIKSLDEISKAMIYWRQGDIKNFDNSSPENFLALFLLGKKREMYFYLPKTKWKLFIDMLNGKKISDDNMDWMLKIMIKYGSLSGTKYLLSKGANPFNIKDKYLINNSMKGNLNMVKFLVEQGANIHINDELALRQATKWNRLNMVKFLIEKGADINIGNGYLAEEAIKWGNLSILKFLIEKGINIDMKNALFLAKKFDQTNIIEYLESLLESFKITTLPLK